MDPQKFTDYEMFRYVKEKISSVDMKYVYYGGALFVGSCVAFYVGDVLDHIPVLNTAATIIGTYHILKYTGKYVNSSVMDKINTFVKDMLPNMNVDSSDENPDNEELNEKVRKYLSKL